MRINCQNITIELKDKIKNDFDIETDVINLDDTYYDTIELKDKIKNDFDIETDVINIDDAYYDTIVLFTKYYNEDSTSKDVLYNILDNETKVITITKMLNLFMFLKWDIDFEFLFGRLFPILRAMPIQNDKIFFDNFDENSIESWCKIVRKLAENTMINQYNGGDVRYAQFYFWILNNLDRYWDKFSENNLFENLDNFIVSILWKNYCRLGDIGKLNKMKTYIGRLQPVDTLCVLDEKIGEWILENYPNIYDVYGFDSGQGPNPRLVKDPNILQQLP
jgi:hypothetical protein